MNITTSELANDLDIPEPVIFELLKSAECETIWEVWQSPHGPRQVMVLSPDTVKAVCTAMHKDKQAEIKMLSKLTPLTVRRITLEEARQFAEAHPGWKLDLSCLENEP